VSTMNLYEVLLSYILFISLFTSAVDSDCQIRAVHYCCWKSLFLTRISGFLEHFQPITNSHNTKSLNFCTIKMPKNPFVNCKLRKWRKIRGPVPRPQEKLFCPRTMVRYDNLPSGYNTIWICKMCLIFLLSEEC